MRNLHKSTRVSEKNPISTDILKNNLVFNSLSRHTLLMLQIIHEFEYYIYHGSYELTYLNKQIRRMSWFK